MGREKKKALRGGRALDEIDLLPQALREQSLSDREIILPYQQALEALSVPMRANWVRLGWEGWVNYPDGRHGQTPGGVRGADGERKGGERWADSVHRGVAWLSCNHEQRTTSMGCSPGPLFLSDSHSPRGGVGITRHEEPVCAGGEIRLCHSLAF